MGLYNLCVLLQTLKWIKKTPTAAICLTIQTLDSEEEDEWGNGFLGTHGEEFFIYFSVVGAM